MLSAMEAISVVISMSCHYWRRIYLTSGILDVVNLIPKVQLANAYITCHYTNFTYNITTIHHTKTFNAVVTF